MNSKILVSIFLLVLAGIAGFFMYSASSSQKTVGSNDIKTIPLPTPVVVEEPDNAAVKPSADKTESTENTNEQAEVLNTGTTVYKELTEQDYKQALDEGKIIYLEFYATWCPTCIAQEPGIIEGLDALERDDVVAFRVNYKDNNTSPFEANLQQQFEVGYQHTKVLLVDGEVVYNDTAIWTSEDVVENLIAL